MEYKMSFLAEFTGFSFQSNESRCTFEHKLLEGRMDGYLVGCLLNLW